METFYSGEKICNSRHFLKPKIYFNSNLKVTIKFFLTQTAPNFSTSMNFFSVNSFQQSKLTGIIYAPRQSIFLKHLDVYNLAATFFLKKWKYKMMQGMTKLD